jgi:hypothetical protein
MNLFDSCKEYLLNCVLDIVSLITDKICSKQNVDDLQSRYFKTFNEPRNRFQFQGIDSASLCSLAGRYDKPIPTRLLAP